jgi:hypothetical protein
MNHEVESCALCAEFSMKADPDLAKEGKGWCRSREEVRHYSDRACVLYERPTDLARRRAWLEKQGGR